MKLSYAKRKIATEQTLSEAKDESAILSVKTYERSDALSMKKKHYENERQGQMEFFDNYRIDYQNDDSILVDDTDGIYHGNILEFKLNISNTGKVLFQAIKYLSKMRIRGESVPAHILLIDLNDTRVYVYNSKDYIDDIQKVYVGAASVGNDAFSGNVNPVAVYDYMDMVDSAEVQKLLINRVEKPTDWYIPVDIDENCIVGWAERYYQEVPKATKGDFLGDGTGKINLTGEIRDPKHFEGLINPYAGKTNEKFAYLMDKLNSKLAKKDLGAFYTPMPYAKKAAELVLKAVERVPDGNDYIILDRCAGTGNLEASLIGLYDKNGNELISHCVVSTYEYYEYKVLLERIGDRVRNVIPPTEANVKFENGNVSNADAMSKEYIENPLIKKYVDDEHCTIILFENPPYRDLTVDHSKNAARKSKMYIADIAKADLKGTKSNDITNLFIWSAQKYYLRQPTDSYVLFSPPKYFKSDNICKLTAEKAFIFNRKHFHATPSAISCILWDNVPSNENNVSTTVFDISADGKLVNLGKFVIKKVNSLPSKLYDKCQRPEDVENGICCNFDGTEHLAPNNIRVKKLYNKSIIGYLKAKSFNFDAMNVLLVRCGEYDAHGYFLRTDNYLRGLPLFTAKEYARDNWWESGTVCTTSDGDDAYIHDPEFLKECLIYTCLSNQNKCLSFTGSDGRYYRNELTFDTTNGNTCASADLAEFAGSPETALDDDENELLALWNNVLEEAKKVKDIPSTPPDAVRKNDMSKAIYNPELTYGVYQITKELNTSYKIGSGSRRQTVYDHPNMNSYLTTLRDKLKSYYKSHITEKMFRYELLK